jgi:hypothetical protein
MTNDTAILSIAPLPENIPAPVSEYYYYNGHFSEMQTSFKQISPLFLAFSLLSFVSQILLTGQSAFAVQQPFF